MAKIAIVSESMKMGGTEIAILALIKKLKKENHNVTLYLIGNHGELINRIPKEIEVREIRFKTPAFRLVADTSIKISKFSLISRIKRKFIKHKIDKNNYNSHKYILEDCINEDEEYDLVCDAFGYGRFTTPYAAICLKGKKKALWFHDENLHWVDQCKDYFKYFDKCFCVSNAVMKELIKKEKTISKKCEVLHNFIEVDEIREKSTKAFPIEFGNNFNILTIGRLEEQKGIDIAIDIANILYKKDLKFHWYVIGDGSLKKIYNDKIKKLKLEKKFTLLGMKNNPYPYLKKCDLYVQPSRHEGYPITLIEARALFCPIIASDIPSISEQIINNNNGFIVELNPIKFSNKIEELMNNPHKIDEIINSVKKEKIDFLSDYKKIEELIYGGKNVE